MREMVGGCCVCSDDRGWSENPLVYCDGQSCIVAVHQACYGIVTVPTGPWYCRKCESQERSVKVKCELCPSRYGALKRTDNSGWAHVVCALYIPEVRFGNVTTMEPIQLQLIPPERFNKICYICEEKGKASSAAFGACMQCNKTGCKQQFHVTCAQGLGLLCEEAGNYLDNVKYCGYCEYHYSKLKKGGNVKTIPPYKPIASENNSSDSNSEKEADTGATNSSAVSVNKISNTQQQSTSSTSGGGGGASGGGSATGGNSSTSSSSKRKSTSSSSKSSKSSSNTKSSSSSSSSHQKTVHSSSSGSSSNKSVDKPKISNSNIKSGINKSVVVDDINNSSVDNTNLIDLKTDNNNKRDSKTEQIESEHTKLEGKENNSGSTSSGSKSSKKRKTNSRTPTPISIVPSDTVSVVTKTPGVVSEPSSALNITTIVDKKNISTSSSSSELLEKPKKAKIETTQSILTNQPVVALTSISTIKSVTSSTTVTDTINVESTPPILPTQSIIQSAQTVNSLVVSVPLTSTTLNPQHTPIINNQTSVLTATPLMPPERNSSSGSAERSTPNSTAVIMTSGSSGGNNSNQSNSIISSEMSGGGLKITYEKQDAVTTEVDMELETLPALQEVPTRTQSSERTEKSNRGKKRNSSNSNGLLSQLNNTTISSTKRNSRSQQQYVTTSPQPGAFSSITQSQIKDSPPSSPSSESQGALPQTSRGRTKGRKSAPASIPAPSSPKDTKDIKLFQNGVNAPHMLGNQLNPNSNMAQKMSDHLNSELEAHSIFIPNDNSNLVGPQLHHRVVASARASSTGGSSTASGGSGLSSMLAGGSGNIPQTLDQLLERQWEQGSQFLMEQAQHFDIASLLSCLHQLRAENLRLEEHVSSLLQRRDHLLAVNARLAIPLTGQPAAPQSSHPHTVNNIHPAVAVSHGDIPRSSRHSSSSSNYPAHPQGSSQHSAGVPIENGLPPESNQAYSQHSHRSPAASQPQPSPTIRHSPAGSGYSNSGILRQSADTSGRAAPRPQPYPLYQGAGSSSQQMVIRRDSDMYHQPSSKPS